MPIVPMSVKAPVTVSMLYIEIGLGDNETARNRYQEFLAVWKTADSDRPELAQALSFLQGT